MEQQLEIICDLLSKNKRRTTLRITE